MHNFIKDDTIIKIFEKSNHKEKSIEVITYVSDLLKKENVNFTEYRWHSLVNHIVAMVERAFTAEKLEGIEADMFSEVSEKSLVISDLIVSKIGNLPKNESYLLSIHFETADIE